MKLDSKHIQQRDRLAELEDQAGGLLAAPDATTWTKGDFAKQPATTKDQVDAILDEVGAPRKRFVVLSMADKRTALRETLTESAEFVLIAARNFESLPDDTVNTLYDALVQLRQKAAKRA